MATSVLATEQTLAAAGFAAGHPDLLADAVPWLETGPHALAQGWLEDPRGLSAAAIGQACTQLPADQTQKIQDRAANYTNDVEKHYRHLYGSAAQRLLRDVAAERLTDSARARLGELNRKFPPSPAAPDSASGAVRDISIQSPVSLDAIQRMNDGQLIGAMRRWASDEWQPLPDGRLRGGASTVAQVVGAAAQADPDRFTSVLESLPADIHDVYIQHILSGLRRSTASPSQALRAIKAARARTGAGQIEIAWLIGHAAPHVDAQALADAGLSMTDLLTMLEEILIVRSGQQLAHSRHVRNAAVLWRRLLRLPRTPRSQRTRPAEIAEAGKKLAERLLAIETAATQADNGPGAVVSIVTTTLNTNGLATDTSNEPLPADIGVLLASDQLRDLLLLACWPHYDLAAPILARMLRARPAANASGANRADLEAAAGLAAQNTAMIIAVAAGRHPQAATLTTTLLRKAAGAAAASSPPWPMYCPPPS